MTVRFDATRIFKALADHEVAYVTIGGVAMQAHGGQRFTQDLDVVIESSPDNYARLALALKGLDARILGPGGQVSAKVPSAELLGSSDRWRLVTTDGRLDILTPPAHLGSFAEMFARAHKVPLACGEVPVAHREDLLELKRNAGRPQDLADIRLLESLDDGD